MTVLETAKLAIDGGAKAKTTPNIPMYPGGYDIGEEDRPDWHVAHHWQHMIDR